MQQLAWGPVDFEAVLEAQLSSAAGLAAVPEGFQGGLVVGVAVAVVTVAVAWAVGSEAPAGANPAAFGLGPG